ncbi:caspase-8 [Hetaerina americana]|uniref:caspase-8 n=1 Tax=Hetaerina americana TaxID=62018 RepID=UPI003A7F1811
MENISTDASPAPDTSPNISAAKTHVTVELIEDLERDMDIYEKVSLVFLLYPDIRLALQRLIAVEANLMSNQLSSVSEICLLSDWARASTRGCGKYTSEDGTSLSYENQSAFVEALCIVQDFKSVARIRCGTRSDGLAIRELSITTPDKYFVNHSRNVLYRVCESLSPSTAVNLIKQVEKERTDLVRPFHSDARLLEVSLLFWASHHFIDIHDNMHVDIRNLSRHLLMLGEIGLAKMLDVQCPYAIKPDRSIMERSISESAASQLPESNRVCGEKAGSSLSIVMDDLATNIETVMGTNVQKRPDTHREALKDTIVKTSVRERMECYKMDPKNMGTCLIINQKNFYRERNPYLRGYLPNKPLEDRLGTDVDRDRLTEAFTSLGFDIKVMSNLTHTQLVEAARQTATNEVKEEHSSVVLCVLSHGQKDVVYGCNSIPVEMTELVEIFCGSKCPALIGKPKIFIFQACQGSKLQKAPFIATDGPDRFLSGVKDYVKFLSTVPGYASLRHKVTGSWFIENLHAEIMGREPNSSLLDVFTLVNASLDKKSSLLSENDELCLISMMSELHSTLRGPVILPLEPDAMKKAMLLSVQRIVFDQLFQEFFASPKKCKDALQRIARS